MKASLILTAAALGVSLSYSAAQTAPAAGTATDTEHVGKRPDGSFLLNSGWTLRPAGEQVKVDTFPMTARVSANGKFLLVLNCGYNPPSVSVIDIAARKEVGRTPVPDAWLGLALDAKSGTVYVGGGSRSAVYQLRFDETNGNLTMQRTLDVPGNPEGPTKSEAASEDEEGRPPKTFIGDVAYSPDTQLLYATDLYGDGVAVIDPAAGKQKSFWKTGRRPYRVLVTPGGRRLLVSSWADGVVDQLDASTGALASKTRVGPHATDMVLLSKPAPAENSQAGKSVARLFVTASNTNNVYSFGIARDGSTAPLETINTSLTPLQPLGMTPSALAVDGDGKRLFIACSDANAMAIADISETQARVVGYVPTGWYPTAVVTVPGGELAILSGKGLGSYPNPNGPNPTQRNRPLYQGGPVVSPGYVGHIQTGTVAFLKNPQESDLAQQTATVRSNTPYRDELVNGPISDEQTAFFTNTAAHASPVKHLIYIIKENRTYDQVLGDMPKGNGDKSLTLFGKDVTPNHHRLADEFILLDNLYENADVSADGHNWAAAAIAPDYTTKTWPNEYAGRRRNYDFEGGEPANTPPAGYLWTNLLQAGLSVRNYGEWVENKKLSDVKDGVQIKKVRDPILLRHTDMRFRSFDLNYLDVDRVTEFLREWSEFDGRGQAPQLSIVRLGNDHTSGTKPGALSPRAAVADNDLAIGKLVEGVSHSKLWGSTAIFIIEDDAQNGPDHVDSHRAPAFVISPWTHRGTVDSNMYNQTSVLRTMELILGLRPLTHFDAAAPPMFAQWSREPDTRAYTAANATYSLTERNGRNAPGAAASARLDFDEEDRIDDRTLNAILWRALKDGQPPAPVRSGFGRR